MTLRGIDLPPGSANISRCFAEQTRGGETCSQIKTAARLPRRSALSETRGGQVEM